MSEPLDELRAIAPTAPAEGGPLGPYLAKVRERAYSVTDGDVEALKETGLSEDEIFEHTVAVAVGEGLRRLDAALRVIG